MTAAEARPSRRPLRLPAIQVGKRTAEEGFLRFGEFCRTESNLPEVDGPTDMLVLPTMQVQSRTSKLLVFVRQSRFAVVILGPPETLLRRTVLFHRNHCINVRSFATPEK
jgi:hypothetical protein